jgi:hypothetical protein
VLGSTLFRTPKLGCLIAMVWLAMSVGGISDQRLSSDSKTIDTPLGKFGFWRLTEIDATYTRHDSWILLGRLGKWHIRSFNRGSAPPLLPIAVLACVAGTVIVAARSRRAAPPPGS